MRILKVFVFLCLFLFVFELSAQTPGSATGFGDSLNQRGGPVELTAEQKEQMQSEGQMQALKASGYSDEQIASYNAKIDARKQAIESGNRSNMPALTAEEQKMARVSEQARRQVNGQINRINQELYNNNASAMDLLGNWATNKDWTGWIDGLNTAGAIAGYTGVAILAGATGGGAALAIGGLKGAAVGTAIATGTLWGGNAFLDQFYENKNNSTFYLVLNAFTSLSGGCWFCPIFQTLFDNTNQIAKTLNSTLGDYAQKLLILGLLFYILFKVAQTLISFGEIDPKQFIKELFMPIIKTIIAVIIITNIASFYTYVLNPLTQLSLGFALDITEQGASGTGLKKYEKITSNGLEAKVDDGCKNVSASSSSTIGFGTEVNDAIQCFLKTESVALIQQMAIGATFMSDCWKHKVYYVFPNLSMFFIGLFMFIGVFLIFITFPFKLIDCIIRLMFVSALLPLWVALWVLPATRDRSMKAFNMFIHVLVSFVVLSVILLMVLMIINASFLQGADFDTFMKYLGEDKSSKAIEMVDWSTGTFFIFIAMMFLAYSLLGKAESFASQFADGGQVGVGGEMTALAIKGAQLPVSKIAAPLVKKGIGKLGEKFGGGGAAAAAAGAGGTAASSAPATARTFSGAGGTGGTTPPRRPSSTSSTTTEQLGRGRTRETTNRSFRDAEGRLTHTEVSETNKNARGGVESVRTRRENFDPTTQTKTGSTLSETTFNRDGTSVKVETEFDAMDRKKSVTETRNGGTYKTEFDDQGRETVITNTNQDRTSSTRTNNYDAAGNLTGYITELKDANGTITSKFRTDNSGRRTNLPIS